MKNKSNGFAMRQASIAVVGDGAQFIRMPTIAGGIKKIILSSMLILIACISYGQEIFIKIINPNIDGESVVIGHQNEIVALRFAQEASTCDLSQTGTGSGVCKATTSSFAFDLNLDKAVIGLRSALYKGTHIAKVQITFRKGGATPFEYYKITLGNVIVSKLTDATNGNSNQFQVQFSAEKFFWAYMSQSGTGVPNPPVTFGWDSVNNMVWDGN